MGSSEAVELPAAPPTTPPKGSDRESKQQTTPTKEKRNAAPQPGSVEDLKAKYAHMVPCRPLNAYFLFLKDAAQRSRAEEALRAEGKQPSITAIGTKLGEMWQSLDDESKSVFTTQVAAAMSIYHEKMVRWKATPEFAELEMAKRQAKKNKKRPFYDP